MDGSITIRGGVVFVASDAILQNVSIFNAQVICPTTSSAMLDLTQSLKDRSAGKVIIHECHLISFVDHAERQYRGVTAKANGCAFLCGRDLLTSQPTPPGQPSVGLSHGADNGDH